MASALPVPEVTDLGPVSVEKLRSVGFDMGPGNANVPPGGSAQAQAFKASTAPAAPTPVPSMRDRISGAVRSMGPGSTAKAVAAAAIPAGLGAAVGAAQRRADLNAEPEPFVPAAVDAPGSIPTAGSMRGPAVVPERRPLGVGPNNEFTRNVANTLVALGPMGAAVPRAGVALPVAASSVGTAGRIRAAGEVAGRSAQGFVAGAQGGAAAVDAAAQPTAAPSPMLPQVATPSKGTAVNENPNGVITRDGNSYSGTDVKAGADIVNPDGSMRTPGGTVTNLQTLGFDGYMKQLNAIRSLGDAPSFNVSGAPSPSPGMSGIGDSGSSVAFAPTIDTRGMSARQADAARARLADREQNKEIASMRENTARAGNSQAMTIAEMNNETSRANNATSNATSIRGQNITAAQAAATAQRAAAVDQRNNAQGRDDEAFKRRGAREQQFATRVEKMFTDADGKVDAPRAARFQEGIDRAVARISAENPDIKSIADLGPEDEQQLVAATTLLERVREQGSSLNPFQIDKIKTMDPLDLVGLQVDPKTGDRMVTRGKPISEGGSRGFVIPKRFFETEEANFFMPGTKTNRFDMLSMRDKQ